MPQIQPPIWTEQELTQYREQAIDIFRTERMSEPLEKYLAYFKQARASVETIMSLSDELTTLMANAVAILRRTELAECCRYLASPPVSADDLVTTAGVTMAPTLLEKEPRRAEILMETILLGLDRERFPWLVENRMPTEEEKNIAVISTASVIAMRQVETHRRNEGKNNQEGLVKRFLTEECGLVEVATREIVNLSKAPEPGQFCSECLVGSRKADIVVSLADGRLMPIECKVSNSTTNSYKRINNDAAVKAVSWTREFGEANIVPAATLSGVFALKNLTYAQERNLTLLWAHNLTSLKDFITATNNLVG